MSYDDYLEDLYEQEWAEPPEYDWSNAAGAPLDEWPDDGRDDDEGDDE